MQLLKELLEAKLTADPDAVKVKNELSGNTSLTFMFKQAHDCYDTLMQHDDMEAAQLMKKVFVALNADRDRRKVFTLKQSDEALFTRLIKRLNISTDGSINADMLKRAGFQAAGRMGATRLVKRDNVIFTYVVDDEGSMQAYVLKPEAKVDDLQQ